MNLQVRYCILRATFKVSVLANIKGINSYKYTLLVNTEYFYLIYHKNKSDPNTVVILMKKYFPSFLKMEKMKQIICLYNHCHCL